MTDSDDISVKSKLSNELDILFTEVHAIQIYTNLHCIAGMLFWSAWGWLRLAPTNAHTINVFPRYVTTCKRVEYWTNKVSKKVILDSIVWQNSERIWNAPMFLKTDSYHTTVCVDTCTYVYCSSRIFCVHKFSRNKYSRYKMFAVSRKLNARKLNGRKYYFDVERVTDGAGGV